MTSTTLNFEPRTTDLNKTAIKARRAAGQIPATLFGKSFSSTPVFFKGGAGQVKNLHSGSMFSFSWKGQDYRATISEIQRDNLAREITHLSFHVIKNDEYLNVELPIILQGRANGERLGGLTTLLKQTFCVRGLPDAIVQSIVIDPTALELGGRICVGDVKLPKGLTCAESNQEETVVICQAPRKEKEATTTAATAAVAAAAAPAN